MEGNELELLGKQLDSIYKKILKMEKRLKTLRKNDRRRTKIPQYAHSAVYTRKTTKKASPYTFLRNNQRSQSPLPKTSSGICFAPAPVFLILPTDSSDESDSYSPCDEDPSISVSLKVHKCLPKEWDQLIQEHNAEIEKISFGEIKKVTSEDINLFF